LEETALPLLVRENEVVIYRSFLKAGLRFPLSKFGVEVLNIFEIFLHQIAPEAIIRMGVFVWAVRSQGLEPSVKCFCNMHELLYKTKAIGKEQYHNNFSCYGFIARSNASYPVPTFRKRLLGAWMEEWFYVKNDLIKREDIKEIIQYPICLALAFEGRRSLLRVTSKHARRPLAMFAPSLARGI
jgi:hypothetical protein